MLGEIVKESGEVRINGSVFYVAQTPWMFNETIKENILFHSDYSPDDYEDVIEKSLLKKVIKII
jgi:ATP-binding cassette, subfamily C (CFTR/MRP), member 1